MNLAAMHFIKALGILSVSKSTHAIHRSRGKGKQKHIWENESDDDGSCDESDKEGWVDLYDNEDEFDIEVNMEIEATPDDVEAMLGTTITDFEAGDVVRNLMAFVNQLRAFSEPTWDFLKLLCCTNDFKPQDLKLWVRYNWGSLSDCFDVVFSIHMAIDGFCVLADGKSNLPTLQKPKQW